MISRFYVWFILLWVIVWLPFRFFTPLYLTIRHTYQLPSAACVNQLTSDWGTFEVMREGLMVLFLLVPFSICFMLWSREKVAWGTHLCVVLVAFCWSVVVLGFDVGDLSSANVSPDDARFKPQNLARDNRWCLYYGGQPGTNLICANNGPCTGPAVDPASFTTNTWFTLRFAFNVIILGFLIIDFWALWVWRRFLVQPTSPQGGGLDPKKIRYQPLARK